MTARWGSRSGEPVARRLDRLVLLARGALLWETAWRALVGVLIAAAVFVSIAWFGLLTNQASSVRVAVFLLSAAGGAFWVWRVAMAARRRAVWPAREAALSRIDRDSGFTHREASAFDDTLANPSDPATAALWKLHQARQADSLASARVGVPKPRLARFDAFAVRAGVLLLFVAAATVAGDERTARLASAFDWGGMRPAPAPGVRVDAWIDPPAYTGKPPIILATASIGPVSAPVGSVIIVRASDPSAVTISTEGAIAPKPADEGAKPDGAKRFLLRGNGVLTLPRESERARFAITAIPDEPPTVELTNPPKPNARGSLTLGYRLSDDYGVIGAEAEFSSPEIDGKPVGGRTLVPPPRIGLALPAGRDGTGEALTTADLSEHPWAGATATMVLRAHDEGGNDGTSEPASVRLPQRRFTKPLARALVEQRRSLVLDPDHRERVSSALDGLMIAPDLFATSSGIYLGLRKAHEQLAEARSDADLVSLADYLWQMALQIEDGDLSEAERDLRAAQKDLRDALARGAPDEEVRKLTQNLRAAMDKFLSEMAERQARENADRGDEPSQRGDRNARAISRDDLKAMMDRMEEMARAGNLADAQRMLEQMQQILENLRTAKRSRRNPQAQEMSRALNDLDALTRDQDALRDDTFRNGDRKPGKAQRRKGGKPDAGQSGGEGGDEDAAADDTDADKASPADKRGLQQRQKAIREKLGDLQRRLERMRRKGEQLGSAGDAMKQAEDALDEGSDGQQPGDSGKPGRKGQGQGQGQGQEAAVDAQGRALEALRKGAQSLAQQMQGQGQGQEQGQGEGGDDASADGDGDPDSGQPREADGESRDPLGRPTSRDPLYNPRARYDPLGVSPALRAQRVLEELRRRLGNAARPPEEIDYLERLLRRY